MMNLDQVLTKWSTSLFWIANERSCHLTHCFSFIFPNAYVELATPKSYLSYPTYYSCWLVYLFTLLVIFLFKMNHFRLFRWARTYKGGIKEQKGIYNIHYMRWSCSNCRFVVLPFQAMAKEETWRAACASVEAVWRWWWAWIWAWFFWLTWSIVMGVKSSCVCCFLIRWVCLI